MGCALCNTNNQEARNMFIPDNGPILSFLYNSPNSLTASLKVLRNHSEVFSPHPLTIFESQDKRSRQGEHEDSLSETVSTTSVSNAYTRNPQYLTKLEFHSLDIVRRKSYLKHLLFETVPCLRAHASIFTKIVNFTICVEYSDLVFLEVLSSRKGTAVFRAKRRDRTDSYAIKCVSKSREASSEREFALLSSLPPHPLLIAMTDCGKVETNFHNFLVFDMVGRGINLYHRVRYLGGMRSNEVRFYAVELLTALEFLHRHGFLHRDVSLKNILLTSKGHIKLSDFDQCCRIGTLPEGNFVEDHPFAGGLAPEQLRGELQSVLADFWQVGWNLVWMRTGSLAKEITQVSKISPEPLHDLCKALLTEDVSDRILLSGIKDHPYFNDINWYQVPEELGEPPALSPRLDRRMDKESETVYYTSIYKYLDEGP